jgi:hypothetical protein
MSDLYEDPDFDENDAEQGGDQAAAQQQPNPVRDARSAERRARKELKEARAELEELRAFKVEYETNTRRQEVSKILGELGLRESVAKLYPSDAEVSSDAVQAFALEYGWLEEAQEEEQEQTAPTFAPVSVAGSTPARGQINKEQLDQLAQTNPAEAQRAINSGRVTDLPPQGQEHYDW